MAELDSTIRKLSTMCVGLRYAAACLAPSQMEYFRTAKWPASRSARRPAWRRALLRENALAAGNAVAQFGSMVRAFSLGVYLLAARAKLWALLTRFRRRAGAHLPR